MGLRIISVTQVASVSGGRLCNGPSNDYLDMDTSTSTTVWALDEAGALWRWMDEGPWEQYELDYSNLERGK